MPDIQGKRIRPLPIQLINQIAAGEVVERPASVIKECVENSVDAGATQITIEIENAGKKRIRITDNGHGIEKDDLMWAIAPHATSKIADAADLFSIASLGFRGEALASIASVSQFTIQSHVAEEEYAWELRNYPELKLNPTAHPLGTSIQVEKLFYNLPVRQQFLKSDRSEYLQIEELVKRLILSRYDIAWQFIADKRVILTCPSATTPDLQFKRFMQIVGKSVASYAKKVQVEKDHFQLWGWVTDPEFSRNQNDSHYVYVNGRLVKDKLLMHAIRHAYGDALPIGRFPALVLYFQLPLHALDVNVHPTKQELRFHEPRMVYDFIVQSIREVVQQESENLLINKTKTEVKSTSRLMQNTMNTDIKRQQYRQNKGIVGHRYLLLEEEDALIRVDLRAARQAFIKMELTLMREISHREMLPLLIPLVITASSNEIDRFFQRLSTWQQLGFDIDRLSEQRLVVRQIPAVARFVDLKFILTQCMTQLNTIDDSVEALIHLFVSVVDLNLQTYTVDEIQCVLPLLLESASLVGYSYCHRWAFQDKTLV